jgi:tetratricopeptide (TPR) repeat protein/tRNA A-37 threonylcarbamoyl transferase component Bud32
MTDGHNDSDIDAGLEAAFGGSSGTGSSMLGRIQRLTGIKSELLLHDGPDEDDSPLTHVHRLTRDEEGAEDDSRYQVAGEIAKGGVGVVYKCRDRDLGRDVAVKVLRRAHVGKPDVFHRFVEEAQIGGQLQHPGIVPVYSLGLQPDGRPSFAMKLVKGRTLSAALADRKSPADDRRTSLRTFERICQTMAYAHARGVIHRDLKPSNVMLGAFGEVLVVDWGFGKVLGRAEPVLPEPEKTIVTTVRSEADGSGSIAGSVMGTPAYMPPEQALGHVEELDEQTDVFALGAILTEILTGKPPYVGKQKDLLVLASQAKLENAHDRLDACDADPELTALAKRCLEPLRGDRPRHAGEVADEMGRLLSKAEERARAAELDAVKQRSRERHARQHAAAERRAKRLAIGLAAAVLVLVAGAGAFFLTQGSRQRARVAAARARVEKAIEEASRLRGRGEWSAALAEAREAEHAAAELDDETRGKVETLIRETEAEKEAAEGEAENLAKDRQLLADLELARLGRFGQVRTSLDQDGRYREAFRNYELPLDSMEPEAAARKIRERGPDFAVQVAVALDHWDWLRRTKDALKELDAERLMLIASICDPDPVRMEIRRRAAAGDLAGLSALARDPGTRAQPVLTITNLASWLLGDDAGESTIDLLESAARRAPDDIAAHHLLGVAYDEEGRHEESLRHLTALAALRPHSSIVLSNCSILLGKLGRLEEALSRAQRAIELDPENAHAHSSLGSVLSRLGRHEEALRAARESLRLAPDNPVVLANLGATLSELGRLEESARAARRAIQLDPEMAWGHANLGDVLQRLGRDKEAIPALRRAMRLDPDLAPAHVNLGRVLMRQRRPREALEELREAVRLDPDSSTAHLELGVALSQLGKKEEALERYRESARLDPELARAHTNLGACYFHQGLAEKGLEAHRRAAKLDPTDPLPRFNLAAAYLNQGRFEEALESMLLAQRLREDRSGVGDLSDRIRGCRNLLEIGPRVPALLASREAPRDVRHANLAGEFCYHRRNLAGAARLLGWAMEEEPEKAVKYRYYAILAAVRAGAGEGEDASALDAPARARWRRQALTWIRADLEWRLTKGEYRHLGGWLEAWLSARELSSVRDSEGLDSLPTEEREAWTALWSDVRKSAATWYRKLGIGLRKEGHEEQAGRAFRKAVGHDPEDLQARFDLGLALQRELRWAEAAEEYREVIRRKPDHAEAHCNLGHCLFRIGEFAGAVESVRRGHKLGSARSSWRYPSARWLERYETYSALVPRLDAILAEEDQPADHDEKTRLMFVFSRKGYCLAALRLWEEMYGEDPALQTPALCFSAACYAARAGTGQAVDGEGLSAEDRRDLRRKTLGWMRQSLSSCRDAADEKTWDTMRRYWLGDQDLACVRTYPALAKLPADERKEWLVFWDDVRIALEEAKEGK